MCTNIDFNLTGFPLIFVYNLNQKREGKTPSMGENKDKVVFSPVWTDYYSAGFPRGSYYGGKLL